VPQEISMATRMYKLASDKGYPNAMNNLGYMYLLQVTLGSAELNFVERF
jgi:TPR repeat protein